MRRRDILIAGGPLLAAAAAVSAQAPGRARQLAFLSSASSESRPAFQAFRARLAELGHVEGGNLVIRFYLGGGAGAGRVEPLAREIVASGPDAVFADGRVATLAMAAATRSIPIISIMGQDPKEFGVAASLARPGGNVTGMSLQTDLLNPKKLELLREMVPSGRRVGIVFSSAGEPAIRSTEAAGAALGLDMRRIYVDSPGDIERVLSPGALAGLDALVVSTDGVLDAMPERVVAAINATSRPAIYPGRPHAEAGGLAAYGINFVAAFRHLAGMVDRVLRGEEPGRIPFEQPDRIELVVNLRTARAQGLTIPPAILARADEVIE